MSDHTSITLNLTIFDFELCAELAQRSEGEDRDNFAVTAMKIGSLALRQAQGRIDADRVRAEGDRLIENMSEALNRRYEQVTKQISDCLKDYFDPESGRFNERVQRLIKRDGELEQVLRKQIVGDSSPLTQTLSDYVGKDSLLMRTLDPESAEGLIRSLMKTTEDTLSERNKLIIREFSLDNTDGALARLVSELEKKNGDLMGEFSLDKEDSALSRLVTKVESAQKDISREFSLDEEGSALARMRKELKREFEKYNEENRDFRSKVLERLAAMDATRKEVDRSPRHGIQFEKAVFEFVADRCQKSGDIAEPTGNKTGFIRNNKKGDIVVTIGPEQAVSGAKIVVEAKEKDSYPLAKALLELEEARKNREADIGLFVFSKCKAPEEIDPLLRYGDDVIVIWDVADRSSDVILSAGLAVAKAICVRKRAQSAEHSADFEVIMKAIRGIEKQAGGLEDIAKSAKTIKSSSEKILNRAEIVRNELRKQVETLEGKIDGLREVVKDTGQIAFAERQSKPPRRSKSSNRTDWTDAAS